MRSTWSGVTEIPWRGYEYDAEGRLTVVHEQTGLNDPIDSTPLGDHSITNDTVAGLVTAHDGDTTDPTSPVTWVREPDVGGLLAIEEADGSTRWEHRDPSDPTARGERLPGHRLGVVALDAASFGVVHDEQGRVTQGVTGTYDCGPRGRLGCQWSGQRSFSDRT